MNLREWIFKNELKKKTVAQYLGITQMTLFNIIKKKKCPDSYIAMAIERLTNGEVPLIECLSPDQREKLDKIIPYKADQ